MDPFPYDSRNRGGGKARTGKARARYDTDMRSRAPLFALLLFVGAFSVPHLAHASIPFLGPIIPDTINRCPAGWGALITVANNIIEFLLTIAIVFVAPIMIAYAGFLYVINPMSMSNIGKAKNILLNTISGIVIALSAWLIVDAVMAVLYNPTTAGQTWSSIIRGDSSSFCLLQTSSLNNLNQTSYGVTGVTSSGKALLSTTPSNVPGNACNPSTITSAVPSATQQQAQLLACIAQGESTCGTSGGPYNLNYSWNKASSNGKASTAAGPYQVLLASNHSCYENATCYAAAGVSGPLNCQNAFDSKGFPIPGSSLVTTCQKAAANTACSAAAAVCLLNHQSFASAYGTDPYLASCQQAYGG